jgi:hypothetical protein
VVGWPNGRAGAGKLAEGPRRVDRVRTFVELVPGTGEDMRPSQGVGSGTLVAGA